MRRFLSKLPTVVGIGLMILPLTATAKDKWVSFRSGTFFVVGNAGERQIRQVAIKLEQFREVVSRLFAKAEVNSPVPTIVIVFKSDNSYRPFKPLYQAKPINASGYFQAGEDVNYITLTSEVLTDETSPYAAIYHEYVHSITNDNTRQAPLWFREGIAEYYSTFEVSDGEKKVWLGKPIPNHVYLLRERKFLPLSTLFSVTHDSPHYNEKAKQGVFYAESWALIHYLMLGNNSRHRQFLHYLNLLASGTPVDEGFRQAFQTDYATLEKELTDYIGRDTYPAQHVNLDKKLEFDAATQAMPVSEAEVQFYLGDLLLHTQRFDDGEAYLKKALSLDPRLASPHASLGAFYLRQMRWVEAKEQLQQAIAADSQNYRAHYNYAQALSREGATEGPVRFRFSAETAESIRETLRRAIELAPGFADSYRLLAYVSLVTGDDLDETITLLESGLKIQPGREEIAFDLGQLYVRKEDYESARRFLEPIARRSRQPHLQTQAQSFLDRINAFERQQAFLKDARQQPITASENTE